MFELMDRFPNHPQKWEVEGMVYEELDNESTAEVAYRRALEYGGEFTLVYLAKLLLKQGNRHPQAHQLLQQAIAATKSRLKCVPCRELAESLIRGDDIQAIKTLEIGLHANQNCVCCLTLLIDIYRRRAEPATFEKQYRAALDTNYPTLATFKRPNQVISGEEAVGMKRWIVERDAESPLKLPGRTPAKPSDTDSRENYAELATASNTNIIVDRLFLAFIEITRNRLHQAVNYLDAVLTDLPSHRKLIPSFVDTAMLTVQLDEGASLMELLDRHENADIVEPLAIAVRMLRGEDTIVAKEIQEVAWDIIQRTSAQTQ